MKKNFTLSSVFIFSILLAGLIGFIVSACKKMDATSNSAVPGNNELKDERSKFFTILPGTNPLVIAVAASIKRDDNNRGFIPLLVSRAGFPHWDKAIVVGSSNSSSTAYNPTARPRLGTSAVLLIPFEKSAKTTSAVLQVNLTSTDTIYQIIYKTRYTDYGFANRANNGWNAKNLFQLFTRFDNVLYGHTKFRVKDQRVIGGFNVQGDTSTTLLEITSTDDQLNKAVLTMCDTYEICEKCPRPARTQAIMTIPCPCGVHYSTQCTIVDIDSDEGMGMPPGQTPGNEGGGGGSGNWTDIDPCYVNPGDPDPCAFPATPAWYPVAGIDDIISGGMLLFENWDVTPQDADKIARWTSHNIDTTGLDPCFRQVFEKIITSTEGNFIGKILSKMDKGIFEANNLSKFNIKIETATLGSDTAGFFTNPNYNSSTGVFSGTIKLNNYWKDFTTDLGWASVLMHEIVHGYLRSIHYTYFFNLSPTQIQNMDVDSLFSSYIDTLLTRNTRAGLNTYLSGFEEWDHNHMADYLLSSMASGLELFDDNSGINKRYYWYLAWGGLWKTRTWKSHWTNYPSHPHSNPASSDADTRGLKYALTATRLDSVTKVCWNEANGHPHANGNPKINGGCY